MVEFREVKGMESKETTVHNLIQDLKSILNKSLADRNYPKAMASISVGCQILYEYNQQFVDDDFEAAVLQLAREFAPRYDRSLRQYQGNPQTILFYDGFGLDTRGVAKMYLNALKKNGYRIIYVTSSSSKGQIPETEQLLRESNHACYYIPMTNYVRWTEALIDVIMQTTPQSMFFYTLPYDVSGAVSFAVMDGKVSRFLIDLTDHAFWLGVRCNDFFCGSRQMSASNQLYERHIDRKKLIKLGVNLSVDDSAADHSGLPFDVQKCRYIFSGGALYKTLGDENLTYYSILRHLLRTHGDLYFLYAGDGDRSEMEHILQEYPERAFLIPERKDFFYLIQHCTLYLNTYPMFGGMMMKYAAYAGKIPITLKHDHDSDGLLLDQEDRKIEYDSYESLIEDVDRLLTQPAYLHQREELLKGSVISENRFVHNVRSTIEQHHTDYEHSDEHIDTTRFKEEFLRRFDIRQTQKNVSTPINAPLFLRYPWMIRNLLSKVPDRIRVLFLNVTRAKSQQEDKV